MSITNANFDGAAKSGAIKKFVVMAGCDGRMKSREYYTEFAEKLPADAVILTAGIGGAADDIKMFMED